MLWYVTLGLGSNVEYLILGILSIWNQYDIFHNDNWESDMFILRNFFEVFSPFWNMTYYLLFEWMIDEYV